ncbi:hypothetical protein HMI54_014613 [Coelomomyces lativittatus]|nr:hypothetical protein HMI54_014613 [Coelomomyces lativittatus]
MELQGEPLDLYQNTSLQRQLDTLTPPLCSQVVSPPTPLSTPSITPSEPSEDAFTSMIKLQRYEERIQQLEKKLNFCQAVSKANEAAAKDSIHFSHLEALKNSHTAYVERLKITHQKALEELRQQHRDELSKIKFIYKSHPSMDPKKEARVVSSSTKSHPEEVSGTSSAETSDTYEEALQLVHEMYQLKLETFQKEKDTELAMLKNQLEEIQSSLDTPLVKSAPDHAHDNQENALLDREKAELLVQIELLTMEQRHLQGWRAEHETLYREEVEAHKKLQMEFQSLKETHGKDRREWQQHVRQLQVDLDQERQVHIQTQRALQHLESTRCELQVQLETLQREMVCKEVAYDQEKETWKVTLDEAERQMCAHTETIEAWKARYHGLESTNACLEQSLLSMEPSLKALQKKNEDLQNAQASLTEKNMDLVSKLCESSSMSHLVDSLKLQNQQLIAALKKYGISFSFENKNDTCVASTIA